MMLLGTQTNALKPWENDPVVNTPPPAAPSAPAPASPSTSSGGFPGIVYGMPKPDAGLDTALKQGQVAAQQREAASAPLDDELKRTQIDAAKAKVQAQQDKLGKAADAKTQHVDSAQNVIGTIDHAQKLVGFTTAGPVGQMLDNIGGTSAHNLQATLNTIKANLGFEQLQAMRDASPTGGALGQVSEKENELLQSTVASLDQAQSPDQLRENLDKVRQHYQNVIGLINGKAPADVQPPGTGAGAQPDRLNVSEAGPSAALDAVIDHLAGAGVQSYDIQPDQRLAVTYGDGTVKEIIPPADVVNGDDYREAYHAKFGKYPRLQVDISGGAAPANDPGAISAGVRSAAQAATAGLATPLAAVVDSAIGGGSIADNLRRERAIDATGAQEHPFTSTLGTVAGAAMVPFGRSARTPGELAKVGAGYGGVYGLTSSDGSLNDRLAGAAKGALGGGTAGYLGGKVAAGIGSKIAARQKVAQDALPLIEAGERQRVPLTAAHVDPSKRANFTGVDATPSGNPITRGALNDTNDAIERQVQALGGDGTSLDPHSLGEMVKGAVSRDVGRTRETRNQLYKKVEASAGDQQVTPTQAVQVLDARIAELSKVPETNNAAIEELQKVRNDLVDEAGAAKPLDFGALQDVDSGLKKRLRVNASDLPDRAQRDAGDVLGAMAGDTEGQLSGEALADYRAANVFNRERAENIEQNYRPIVGRKSNAVPSERVGERLLTAAKRKGGSIASVNAIVGPMSPEERQNLAATMVSRMGSDNVDGAEAFSAAKFLKASSDLSPAAKKAIFGDGGARNLQDLEMLARAQRDVAGSLNNSRTAVATNWSDALKRYLGMGAGSSGLAAAGAFIHGGTGAAVGAVGGLALGAGKQALASRAARATAKQLTNPKILAELARAARADTSTKRGTVVQRLGQLSARLANRQEPALAQEIMLLRDHLQEATQRDRQERRKR